MLVLKESLMMIIVGIIRNKRSMGLLCFSARSFLSDRVEVFDGIRFAF